MTIGVREFEALEEDTDTFDIRVDGVPVWERIRFGVYQSILEQNGVGQAHTGLDGGVLDYVKGLSNWLKNWAHRNPYLADSADVMFVGHQRRKKHEDGFWWDLYCDPIHEACHFDSVHFEQPYLLSHRTPAKTERLRYLDLIQHGGTLQRKLGLHRLTVPAEEADQLAETESEIASRFDAGINLEARVVKSLRRRRSELWLWRRLLKRVSPEVVVLVVSYGKEPLIEACKEAGIPLVELQHGLIYPRHLAYNYQGSRSKEMFPDYLFTWGKYWCNCVEYPIAEDYVVPVGFPYIEMEREKYHDVEKKDQVIFLSQGTVGAELSKFAVECGELSEFEMLYKLHPGEYDRWRDEYPWLETGRVTVIDDDSRTLYRLFAESTAQVGVYSTAIFEGLCFNLNTFLVNLPNVDSMEDLYQEGLAEIVDSPTELINALEDVDQPGDPNTSYYFKEDAAQNMQTAIERVREVGHPQADQ